MTIPEIVYKHLPKSQHLWFYLPLVETNDLTVICTKEKLQKLCLRNVGPSNVIGEKITCGTATINLVYSSIEEWAILHGRVGDALISLFNETRLEIV